MDSLMIAIAGGLICVLWLFGAAWTEREFLHAQYRKFFKRKPDL